MDLLIYTQLQKSKNVIFIRLIVVMLCGWHVGKLSELPWGRYAPESPHLNCGVLQKVRLVNHFPTAFREWLLLGQGAIE